MGGVFPLTMRIAAGGLDVGRPRRRARLRAEHARRHRRLVPLRLRGAAELGLQRGIYVGAWRSTWRWRRCCSASRPTAGPQAAAPASPLPVGAGVRWGCCCRAGTWSRSPPASSACRSRASTSAASRKHVWKDPKLVFYEDGIATTVSVEQWDARRLAQEQRQGRRLERRRHADADHGRPAAAAVLRPGRRRPRWRWSASARASPRARSPSTRSARRRSSSWSRPSTARRASSRTTTTARCRTRRSRRASATGATS